MLPAECDVSDDVCCGSLFAQADHLRSSVYTALLECFDADCPSPPLTTYVTMGQGDDGVVDSLAVAFTGTLMSEGSTQAGGKLIMLPLVRAQFDVRLRESGWPTVHREGGVMHAPDPARQHALARHAFAHGERMYLKLLSMHANRTLVAPSIKRCSASLSNLLPLPPLGGTIGFYVVVTADMPWSGGMA